MTPDSEPEFVAQVRPRSSTGAIELAEPVLELDEVRPRPRRTALWVAPALGVLLALFVAVLWALIFVRVRPAFAGLFQSRLQTRS